MLARPASLTLPYSALCAGPPRGRGPGGQTVRKAGESREREREQALRRGGGSDGPVWLGPGMSCPEQGPTCGSPSPPGAARGGLWPSCDSALSHQPEVSDVTSHRCSPGIFSRSQQPALLVRFPSPTESEQSVSAQSGLQRDGRGLPGRGRWGLPEWAPGWARPWRSHTCRVWFLPFRKGPEEPAEPQQAQGGAWGGRSVRGGMGLPGWRVPVVRAGLGGPVPPSAPMRS